MIESFGVVPTVSLPSHAFANTFDELLGHMIAQILLNTTHAKLD